MSCSLYNANGFGCCGCPNFVKSTSIVLSGTTLQITIPNTLIRNNQKFCIALCQNIPTTITQNTPVQISVNGQTFALINKCGNAIYADQLRCRTVLHTSLATDTLIAMLNNNSKLCKTDHGFPLIPVPATAATSAAATTYTNAVAPAGTTGKAGAK